jgi:hypothetical protein
MTTPSQDKLTPCQELLCKIVGIVAAIFLWSFFLLLGFTMLVIIAAVIKYLIGVLL